MITDFKAFLESDTQLATLINAGTGNTKIKYIGEKPGEESPWVDLSYSTDGSTDELLNEGIVNVSVYAETYLLALAIVKRIRALLDVQDDMVIISSEQKIFYGKMIGGGSDNQEPDTLLFHFSRLFHVKYKLLDNEPNPEIFYSSLLTQQVNPGLYNDIVATNPLDYMFRYATDAQQLLYYTKDITKGDNGWTVVA